MRTNNKQREALAKILGIADHVQMRFAIPELANQEISELKQIAEAALAEPVRNCDVGAWEEQSMRFEKFCDANTCLDDNGNKECSCRCPARRAFDCSIFWAQMPYEEGGAK